MQQGFCVPINIVGASQVVKNLPANAGNGREAGSIPGSQRSLEVGNGHLLQYSCLENSKGIGAWWAKFHGSQRVRHD